jgi:TP901 family phage tail tape measure protein
MAGERDLSLATIFTARISEFQAGVRSIRRELNALNTDMQRGMQRAAQPMDDMAKAQALYTKRVQEMAGVNSTYQRALDKVIASTDGSARSVQNAIRYMDRMQATVNKQSRALDAAGKSGRNFAKGVDYVNLVTKDSKDLLKKTATGFTILDESAKRAAKSQSWIGKQIAQVEGAMARLGAAMKVTAAYGVAASAIYSVVDALGAGVREIIEYDQALKNLKAITGATDAEIRAMGDTIKQVARTTKFSMTETADAMVLLGQAGFDAGESMDAMQATADLATGTLSDMQTVTDLLTTAIRAFNLESFQAGQVSDIMANAINKSKLTVDKLRIAFNYVGPAAYAVGAELEEVAAAMMTLANSGLRASTIGTGLRQVFSRLVAPSAKLREAFEEHGISLEDLNVKVHGFVGVMHNLSEVFVDAESGAIDAQKAFELFGLRGANSVLALMKGINSGEFQEALKHVYEVGTAANMAGIQIEGLSLQIKNLQDRFKSLMVELGGRGFTDVLSGIVGALRELTRVATEFVEEGVGGVVAEFTTFVTTALAATIGIRALGKAVVWVTRQFLRLSKALLSHPIGWLILMTGSLLGLYKKYRRELRENLELHEKEMIQFRARVDVLESYRKRLEEAHKEAQKDQTMMAKYEAIIKRLKLEFEDLSKEVDSAGGNFEKLNQILKEEATVAYMNELRRAFEALGEQEKIIEATRATSGMFKLLGESVDKAKTKVQIIKDEFVDWAKKASQKIDMTFPEELQKGADAWKAFRQEAYEAGKTSEETLQQQEYASKQMEALSDMIVRGYKAQYLSLEELKSLAEIYAQEGEVSLQRLSKVLEIAIAKIEELERKAEIEPLKFSVAEAPFEKMIKEAEGFRQVELLNLKRSIDQQISAYKDLAKKRKITDEEAEKNKAAIMFQGLMDAYDIFDKETELDWKRNQKKIEWAEQFVSAYRKYAKEQIAIGNEVIRKSKEQYGEDSKEHIRIKEETTEKIKALENSLKGVVRGAEEEKRLLRMESTDEALQYDYEQRIAHAERATAEEISRIEREGARKKQKKEEIDLEIARLERQFAQERLRLLTEYTNKIIATYGLERDEFIKAREEMLNAQIEFNQALAAEEDAKRALQKKNLKLDMRDAKDMYREGRLAAEEYFEYIEQAREDDLISEKEYLDQKAILMGGYWESLKRGFNDAKAQIKSSTEVMYELGSTLPEMIATGLADAFSEAAKGAKSFEEAMEEMFINILEYIAETIIQTLLLQTIMAGVGLLGGIIPGGSTAATSAATGTNTAPTGAGGMTLRAHEGGILGVDPLPVRITNPKIFENARRLHNGLASNEFPAILKKGEGVFTEGQMKAIGNRLNEGQTASSMSINVPVNVEYTSPRFTSALRSNVEEAVKRTIRQELQ